MQVLCLIGSEHFKQVNKLLSLNQHLNQHFSHIEMHVGHAPSVKYAALGRIKPLVFFINQIRCMNLLVKCNHECYKMEV